MSSHVILEHKALERGEMNKLMRRQAMDTFMAILAAVLAVLAVAILFTIFGHIMVNGFSSLNWDFVV